MPLPTLGQVLIILAALFAVFRGLELLRPHSERTPLQRPGLMTDIAYWIFNPLVAERIVRWILSAALALVAFALYGKIERELILGGFGPFGALPLGLQVVLMLVIGDFIGYWTHRLFHRGRLWNFHAIHHAPTTLDWLSAARSHPVNEVLGKIAMTATLLILGFKLQALAWAGPIFGFYALLLHANLNWDYGPFRRVIASPRFHRWHHTSDAEVRDKNFAGLFPIWDVLFGTYYMPTGKLPSHFGTDTPVPAGIVAQMIFPFRRQKVSSGPPNDA